MSEEHIKGRVLIVDDDPSILMFYEKVLGAAGFQTAVASNLGEMRTRLGSLTYDIVLLDLNLGDEHGLDGLSMILKDAPFTKVYILTGEGSVESAVECMRRGASGFFQKGGDVEKMVQQLTAQSKDPVRIEGSLESIGLIGQSPALMTVAEKIERLKDVDSMILILGESGTGKEVVARAIHRTSQRANQRFDAINCGAIPEALLESELFGHKRGAFTDAKTDRKGIFELCSSGTLLLDEIGDMPLSLQMKLLRVLQERVIMPVGSSTSVKVNTRVIAATHRDILAEAREKRFREDLYYRISIVVLHIPPLRERLEDIPLLVRHFLEVFNRRFVRDVKFPSPSVMSQLMAYHWPGNVRELQNAIERAVVLSTNGEIDAANVFAHLTFGQDANKLMNFRKAAANDDEIFAEYFELPLTEAKQAFERRYLEFQLKRCGGHVVEVAERSGRYRADVYRLLTRYGIDHSGYRN
jgi:DNA-binding NtrC family response regulator